MALDPLELGTIAAVLLVFFIWGPQKIPELARMLAQARREFDNASREFQKVSASIADGTSPFLAPPAPLAQSGSANALPPPSQSQAPGANQSTPKTGDQLLIEAARRLGITTGGKTREQIQEEIIALARRPYGSEGAPPPPRSGD